MVLPVLPTTPFLLLASYLFARSSPRFNEWLLSNRLFGTYIRNYREGKGITLLHKITALAFLWLTIAYAAYVVPTWWVRVLLAAIALGVTIHLLRAKTYRPNDLPQVPDRDQATRETPE
jgi:hypothetical protein